MKEVVGAMLLMKEVGGVTLLTGGVMFTERVKGMVLQFPDKVLPDIQGDLLLPCLRGSARSAVRKEEKRIEMTAHIHTTHTTQCTNTPHTMHKHNTHMHTHTYTPHTMHKHNTHMYTHTQNIHKTTHTQHTTQCTRYIHA